MAKNISNKLVRGLLALSAGFLLASCDPVSALPTKHDESIVVKTDNSSIDVTDNDLLQIYNLVESGKNEEAVSKILRGIAEDKFGTYEDLYNAVKDATKRGQFIKDHSSYFGEESDTYKDERFNDFVKDIDSRISEAFYNEITSGSYNDEDGKFSELKLYNAKKYELYDLVDATAEVKNNSFYVEKELTKENALKPLQGTDNWLKGTYHHFKDADGKEYRGYIEEKVYPEILKNKLVESYIFDKNKSTLGRAYAREIEYVKVSYEEEELLTPTWNMLKSFADTYIKAGKGLLDFEKISGVVKGFTSFNKAVYDNKTFMVDNIVYDASQEVKESVKVKSLLDVAYPTEEKVHFDKDIVYLGSINLVKAGDYYKNTKLGKILDSFKTAIAAEEAGRFATASQKTELEKFTGEGKSKEYGLMQKIISLAKEDYTTDGWFLKNGGASELPSALRDRLFNIKVANILDDNVSTATHQAALPEETTIGVYDEKNYVRNINGNKLLLASDASPVKDEPYNYIYHDYDGKAFYICVVNQAPSTAKFNEKSESRYEKNGDFDTARVEQLSRQIAKVLGTKDSYIKDAYTDILKSYTFEFYDTSLFEYLNSEYPDLELDE